MRVLRILDEAKLLLVELEVPLGGTTQTGTTLCAQVDNKIIPLNTPDMRPILLNFENAIEYQAED